MKLYLISQTVNNCYDTYDSAVVRANTPDEARMIHPGGSPWDGKGREYGLWCNSKDVNVECIGESKHKIIGVVLTSFNAG